MRESHDSLDLVEEESGMSTMLIRNTEKYNTSLSLQLGIPYTYAMFAYTRKMDQLKRKVRVALKVGSFGAILEYGLEERVTSQSSISATMVVGFPTGVTCRLKLTRGRATDGSPAQTYLFPFHLSDEILVQPIFYGTVCPLLLWFSVKKLVVEPYQAKKREEARRKKREVDRERLGRERAEAEASVALMEERYNRVRAAEEGRKGLVLHLVLYGRLADTGGQLHGSLVPWELAAEPHPEVEYVDITRPIQCEVEDARLLLWVGIKTL